MLSGHCKIYQVSLEAQVVQGAQCSSQNLQNQTDRRLAHYQNRLLQCEQTGCRLVHRQCRRDSFRVESSCQQTVLRSRAQALFWTGVKTCPINPNTRAPADRQDTILGKSSAHLMNPRHGGEGGPQDMQLSCDTLADAYAALPVSAYLQAALLQNFAPL